MALELPVQVVIDRRIGYAEFLLHRPIPPDASPPDVVTYLLDPLGGPYGGVPDDPPAVRGVPFGLV